MYGLGAAERELGRFASSRRDQITIATKFGVEPIGPTGRLARLQAPARAVISRFPALKETLKRRADVFHQPHYYDPTTARTSLQTSLRELGTDYVDILFIHDPAPDDYVDMAELSGALEEMRNAGYLRAWGLSGEPNPCIDLNRGVEIPACLQLRDDIFAETSSQLDLGPPVITFGILSHALKRVLSHVTGSGERRSRWSQMVGKDCGHPEVLSSLLLQDALDRNQKGVVLFSTTRPERVRIATAAAEELSHKPNPAPLRVFRELVRAELTPGIAARD